MNRTVNEEAAQFRRPDYPIDPIFLNRWSPRSFLQKEVPDEVLCTVLEAARWAPSGSNEQPWRFILARTPEDRETFMSFLNEGNRLWCERVPVMALILSKKINSNDTPSRSHAFDAGAAWGFLSLEATRQGLIVHAMTGYQPDKARALLNVPEEYELQAVVSIGYRGPKEALTEQQQEREKPSVRRPLKESLFEGGFGKAVR